MMWKWIVESYRLWFRVVVVRIIGLVLMVILVLVMLVVVDLVSYLVR